MNRLSNSKSGERGSDMEWIKCSDRLPETGTFALIVGQQGFKSVAIKSFNGWSDQLFGQHYFDCDDFITHWVLLPQPPQEGE